MAWLGKSPGKNRSNTGKIQDLHKANRYPSTFTGE
jgi:hypothetical protein